MKQSLSEHAVFAQQIQDVWSGCPEIMAICLAILDYLRDEPERNLQHISFGDLSLAVELRLSGWATRDVSVGSLDEKLPPASIIAAVQYLCGCIDLLRTGFEFIDEDGLSHDIPLSSMSLPLEIGVFNHPITGCPINDFESKLFIYFKAGECVDRLNIFVD